MKKVFLIAVATLLMSYFSNAQKTHAAFGVKTGVNIASINVNGGGDFDSRAGFYVGGLAHIHLSKYFAVQPEVIYSGEGGDAGNIKRKEDYINIPVLAQYMTNTGFRFQTGPQVGFLIAAKNKAGDVEVNVKDQLNTVEFAWTFGASYLTKTGLGLDGRYNLGISNINDNESPEARNRVFQVGAFYQFTH